MGIRQQISPPGKSEQNIPPFCKYICADWVSIFILSAVQYFPRPAGGNGKIFPLVGPPVNCARGHGQSERARYFLAAGTAKIAIGTSAYRRKALAPPTKNFPRLFRWKTRALILCRRAAFTAKYLQYITGNRFD